MADITISKETNSYSNVANINKNINAKCYGFFVTNTTDQSMWIAIDKDYNNVEVATIGGNHCHEIPSGATYEMTANFLRKWSFHLIGSGTGMISISTIGLVTWE